MKLEEAIIIILQKEPNLKANEIVNKLKDTFNIDTDKTKLNKILYGPLNSKLEIDDVYRWSLKNNHKIGSTVDVPTIKNTLLSKLSAYYLDCLSKDIESGISCYASNKYGSPDYGQLFSLPNFQKIDQQNNFELIDVKNTIQKVKKDKNRLILQLGYPINLRKLSTAKYTFNLVEPLFLIPVDMEKTISSSQLIIKDEVPTLNVIAIKNLSGLEKNELLQEILILNEKLGLNNSWENLPDFDDLVLNLNRLRPNWKWLDELDVINLKNTFLKDESETGIHNAAAVFFTERSKYTVGLEKELQDFQKIDEHHLNCSSLGAWLSGKFPSLNFQTIPLVEPLPLNDEQRDAVNLALQSPLTVITGPPGTGKSQVVTSLIINAIYNGQTVLFSSKNHKAVDVVYERINGLASRHIMLRLGNSEMQSELAKYLSSLLSEDTNQDDLRTLEILQNQRLELINKINLLKGKDKKLIDLINENTELENKIENIKKRVKSISFNRIKSSSLNSIEKIEKTIIDLNRHFTIIDNYKKSIYKMFLWFFIKKSALKNFDTKWINSIEVFNSFGITIPNDKISEANTKEFSSCLNQLLELIELGKCIHTLQDNIEKLNNNYNTFQLTKNYNKLEELASENSIELWASWLKALPNRLTQENRKVLGEFNTLLNLVVNASADKSNPDKSTFARYYKILPKIAHILPCWAVTSLSVKGKVPFQPGFFDLVIIDEASQCDISSALPLLYRAKRAVIIGDNKQLSHISMVSTNQDIQLLDKHNLGENNLIWSYVGNSLFGLAQSICEQNHIITLKDHHRSHSDIINFSNNEFYDGKLRIATNYNKLKTLKNEPSVRWENIKGLVISPRIGGAYNEIEAIAVVNELKRIIKNNYEGTIGVVSPFRAQANLINEIISKDVDLCKKLMAHNFMADTVHRFQGDERDLIIFSTVISKELQSGAKTFLLKTGNLFNVAITRARAKLLIVGDFNECAASEINYMVNFTKYISKINTQNSIGNLNIENLGPEYPHIPWEVKVSDWEKLFYEALYSSNIKTIPQYKIDQYSLDLALIVGNKKLDIEIDGKKFHQNWDGELLIRDKIRNKCLIELGWDVQRFWVYELQNDMHGCVSKIQEWIDANSY